MQQMKQEGVQPDIRTYTSFINACCKAGDMLVLSFSQFTLFYFYYLLIIIFVANLLIDYEL